MSVLAPLYFAGALAIGLPILFHLIRRTPKSQRQFSSLLFLDPTPPRLTRRSRLDHWPLLLLRALALLLLCAAFARPFFRSLAKSEVQPPGRRVVLMLDTSASMQRTGLWQQAVGVAGEIIDDLQPSDQLALVSFDQKPKTWFSLGQSDRSAGPERAEAAKAILNEIRPTWFSTQTGKALAYAAEIAATQSEAEGLDPEQRDPRTDSGAVSRAPKNVTLVLVTDLQQGSHLEQLQSYDWPENVRVDVRRIRGPGRTNATSVVLGESPSGQSGQASGERSPERDDPTRMRVRVSNSAASDHADFSLAWSGQTKDALTSLPVQVPPGQSRIVRMPMPPAGSSTLELTGDDDDFDNRYHIVAPEPKPMSLVFLGRPAESDRDSLLYYLDRVPLSDSRRTVQVKQSIPADTSETAGGNVRPDQVPLIVINRPLDASEQSWVKKRVVQGSTAMVVLTADVSTRGGDAAGIGQTIAGLGGGPITIAEGQRRDYHLLSRIDFDHRLFASMSDPQFNDFTKVRFWSHRKLENFDADWNIVARYDDQDPAFLSRSIERGRLVVMASGWQPAESQLALSTKFLPLVFALFQNSTTRGGETQQALGERLDIQPSTGSKLRLPSGELVRYEYPEDQEQIDEPGVYTVVDGDAGSETSFAMNLAASESLTEPLGQDQLESLGVLVGQHETSAQAAASDRQLKDRELEGRQSVWRWLLVATLALLGIESFWGSRLSRRDARPADAVVA